MKDKIKKIRDKDGRQLAEIGVGLAVVFGSVVTGKQHPGSDVDIGVVFSTRDVLETDPVRVYGVLQDIFSPLFLGKNIDIVYLHEAPLSLQFRAVMEGKLLYTQSAVFAADYKERVMKLYFDFLPVEQEFQRATFDRL